MKAISFSDYYKFVVSVGIALAFSGFSIIWLPTTTLEPAHTSADGLKLLTAEGRRVVERQLWYVEFVQCVAPWVGAACLVAAFVLIVFGLPAWKRKQEEADEKAQLELREQQIKVAILEQQDPRLKAKRLADELADEDGKEAGESRNGTSPGAGAPPRATEEGESKTQTSDGPQLSLVASPVSAAHRRYLAVEDALVRGVRTYFGEKGVVNTLTRMGKMEYDAIVQLPAPYKDVVFEFKYRGRMPNLSQLRNVAAAVLRGRRAWELSTHRSARAVLVFVVDQETYDVERMARLRGELFIALNNEVAGTFPHEFDMQFVPHGLVIEHPELAIQSAAGAYSPVVSAASKR